MHTAATGAARKDIAQIGLHHVAARRDRGSIQEMIAAGLIEVTIERNSVRARARAEIAQQPVVKVWRRTEAGEAP
jgi:hypothetical protein